MRDSLQLPVAEMLAYNAHPMPDTSTVAGRTISRYSVQERYAELGRPDEASRELNLAVTLRANEASILHHAAWLYCLLGRKPEVMEALRKAWEAGSQDAVWTRRDPGLILLHGHAEFERLYPETPGSPQAPI